MDLAIISGVTVAALTAGILVVVSRWEKRAGAGQALVDPKLVEREFAVRHAIAAALGVTHDIDDGFTVKATMREVPVEFSPHGHVVFVTARLINVERTDWSIEAGLTEGDIATMAAEAEEEHSAANDDDDDDSGSAEEDDFDKRVGPGRIMFPFFDAAIVELLSPDVCALLRTRLDVSIDGGMLCGEVPLDDDIQKSARRAIALARELAAAAR